MWSTDHVRRFDPLKPGGKYVHVFSAKCNIKKQLFCLRVYFFALCHF